MLGSPDTKGGQCFGQRSAERREGIFDFWWNLFEVEPIDDSVCLQFLELLNEHLVAHASNRAPQFAIATRTMREVKQYQGLPLPSDHSQGGIQAAGETDRYHLCISHRYLPKGAYWQNEKQLVTPRWTPFSRRLTWAGSKAR